MKSEIVSMKYGQRQEIGLPQEEIWTVSIDDSDIPRGGHLWRVTIYGPKPTGWIVECTRHDVHFSDAERSAYHDLVLATVERARIIMVSANSRMLGEIPCSSLYD